ncbi:MAG: GAF domain-containing protein [Campylobacterota bacterium]|nr:GAF domain-containing protein [Campylobacterota bacterium]
MKYATTYQSLAKFGRELLEKKSLEDGLPLISEYAKTVIGAERCSIFILDRTEGYFWTTIADGVERIVVPSDKGLVGLTLQEKKPIVANDPYSHPAFMSDVDKATGFVTKNIITAPIFTSKREIIGILELINKDEDYDSDDTKFMIFFAHYVSGFLELTNVYLNQEKNKNRDN